MVADIAIELEAMRLMTWRAASRAEQGLEFHQQAYLAKTFCGEHAMKIGTDGVQLLGGHGFLSRAPGGNVVSPPARHRHPRWRCQRLALSRQEKNYD